MSKKKNHKPPLGIAHFLEHKMFEEESGIDPFTFFSESGTDCNASTSFDNTAAVTLSAPGVSNTSTSKPTSLKYPFSIATYHGA